MQVSRKFRERPHMKAIFISRYEQPRTKKLACIYDIAIISDDDKYIEYAIQIDKDKNLTYYQLTRFRSIFNKWKIDIHTAVTMTKTITVKHPLYIFFQILSHQIGFTLYRLDMDVITRSVSRECQTYIQMKHKRGKLVTVKPAREITAANLKSLWKKLVQNKRCPWINYDVDRYIRSRRSNVFIKRKQWVRVGGLYMVFKLWRKGYNDRYNIRRQMMTDRQYMELESAKQDALRFPKLRPKFYGPNDPLLKELEAMYGYNPTTGRIADGYDDVPAIMKPDETDAGFQDTAPDCGEDVAEPENDMPPELNG